MFRYKLVEIASVSIISVRENKIKRYAQQGPVEVPNKKQNKSKV